VIRTIETKRLQLRFDWTGFALYWGERREKEFHLYWWGHPRIIFHDGWNGGFVFPRYHWYR